MNFAFDSSQLRKRTKVIRDRFGKYLDLDLTLSAKRSAFYLMEYTLPVSNRGNAFPIAPLKSRIWNDVHKVYPSVGQERWTNSAYSLIEDNYSKQAAGRFLHDVIAYEKSGFELTLDDESGGASRRRKTPEEVFSSFRKVPRKTDDKAYSALLKAKALPLKKGRKLAKDTRPLAMVTEDKSAKLARARQKNAGLAKTGYYAISQSLGGQQNYRASASVEGQFVWPKECAAINRRIPGLGSSTKQIGDNGGRVTITSHVRYADEALPEALKGIALRNAANAMRIIFEKRFKNRNNYEITAIAA